MSFAERRVTSNHAHLTPSWKVSSSCDDTLPTPWLFIVCVFEEAEGDTIHNVPPSVPAAVHTHVTASSRTLVNSDLPVCVFRQAVHER